jgi:hypothetical protein
MPGFGLTSRLAARLSWTEWVRHSYDFGNSAVIDVCADFIILTVVNRPFALLFLRGFDGARHH